MLLPLVPLELPEAPELRLGMHLHPVLLLRQILRIPELLLELHQLHLLLLHSLYQLA